MGARIASNRGPLLVAAALALVVAGVWLFWPRATVKSVQRDLTEATLQGDVERIVALMDSEEIVLENASQSAINQYVKIFVLKHLAGFRAAGPPVEEAEMIANQKLVHPDGRAIWIAFPAWDTPAGPKGDEVSRALLWTVFQAHHPVDGLSGAAFVGEIVRSFDEVLPELEALELKGCTDRNWKLDKLEFRTWRELRDKYAAQYERMKAKETKR